MTVEVPVAWITYEPDTLSRGHWDEAMIEDAMSGAMWRVPGGVTFVHHVGEWPDAPGCVVVLPARHNVDHVERLNRDLARYEWVLVIGTGDEESRFDWSRLTHPRRIVWAMGARPTRCQGVDRPLGSGYSPGFPKMVAEASGGGDSLSVFFCGQETHDRRRECVAACEAVAQHLVIPTDRFLADGTNGGLLRVGYAEAMTGAMVAPCPSGPVSVDSFRIYEALEAGAVPVADGLTPRGSMDGYWPYVFWGPVPFPIVEHWAGELPGIVERVRAGWPRDAARIAAWWSQWKRRFVYALHADVRELSGVEPIYETPDDMISVIIPTCPIPSHPDTAMIETVVESVRAQLPAAEIVIVCDGVRPVMQDRAAEYEEFVHRLTRLCQQWHNVVPVILDEWSHQSGGTAAALELVTTPLILFVEHDTPLTGEIDWPGICEAVESGAVHMVRLHHETRVGPDHVHMALDDAQPTLHGAHEVPMIRTTQWSQRPHVARTDFYRERIMPLFAHGRTYIEWLTHSAIQNGIEHGMEQQWDKWRVCVYAPPGDNIQRSLHLDGRAGASTDDSVQAFEELQAATRKAAEEAP